MPGTPVAWCIDGSWVRVLEVETGAICQHCGHPDVIQGVIAVSDLFSEILRQPDSLQRHASCMRCLTEQTL